MKRNIINSIIVSLIINIICFLINLINVLINQNVPLSLEIPGGDCIEYIGFGIRLLKIFPETTLEYAKTNNQINIDILSLLISLLSIFIIVFLLITIYKRIKK